MRRLRLVSTLFALSLPLSLTACGSLNEFETAVSGEAVIPGNDSLVPVLLQSLPVVPAFTDMDFSENDDFKNNKVQKRFVTSAQVQEVTLTILEPADGTFDFLDELSFTAEADGREALIAQRSGIRDLELPGPNPTLKMDLRETELHPFVTADRMTIRVDGKGRQPLKDTKLQARVKLKVEWQL